jgi:hypothetical protein
VPWLPEGWEEMKAWTVALRYEYDPDSKILRVLNIKNEDFFASAAG